MKTTMYIVILVCFYSRCEGQNSLLFNKYQSPFFTELDAENIESQETRTNSPSQKFKNPYTSIVQDELAPLNPKIILTNKYQNLIGSYSKPDLSSFNLKSEISQKNRLSAKIEGSIEIESYQSNFQLPYTLSENQYIRIRANPTLSLFGLPFTSDFFYTTEDNSYYNSSAFTLRFDVTKFKQGLIDQKDNSLKKMQSDLNQSIEFKEDIDRYKNDVQRATEEVSRKIEKAVGEYADQQKRIANDSLLVIQNKALNKKDSISAGLSETVDSSHLAFKNYEANYQEGLMYLNAKKDKLEAYLKTADSIQHAVSTYQQRISDLVNLKKQNALVAGKNQIRKNKQHFYDSLRKTTAGQIIKKVSDFELGLSNPYYSQSTLNGIPIRGVNIKLEEENGSYYNKTSVGVSVNTFNSFLSQESINSLYSRRVTANKFGIGSEFFQDAYIINAIFWDPEGSNNVDKRNVVNALGFNFAKNRLSVLGELGHSIMSNSNILPSESGNLFIDDPINGKLSINSELKYSIIKGLNVKLKLDQKQYGYSSLGSPFLRNDYRQLDGYISHSLLKGKLTYSGFYKHFTDNLSGFSSSVNQMKGFGLTAQSNFKKAPNFFVSYSPFEQGNNHQDSILRTNNKFQSLVGQVNYQKSIGGTFLYSSLSYTNAQIEYQENDFNTSSTEIYSLSQMVQTNKLRINTTIIMSRTNPSIDSLDYNSLNFNCTYSHKKFRYSIQCQNKQTKTGGLHLQQSLRASTTVKRTLKIEAYGGIGKLKGLWGVEQQKFYFVGINAGWMLGVN